MGFQTNLIVREIAFAFPGHNPVKIVWTNRSRKQSWICTVIITSCNDDCFRCNRYSLPGHLSLASCSEYFAHCFNPCRSLRGMQYKPHSTQSWLKTSYLANRTVFSNSQCHRWGRTAKFVGEIMRTVWDSEELTCYLLVGFNYPVWFRWFCLSGLWFSVNCFSSVYDGTRRKRTNHWWV